MGACWSRRAQARPHGEMLKSARLLPLLAGAGGDTAVHPPAHHTLAPPGPAIEVLSLPCLAGVESLHLDIVTQERCSNTRACFLRGHAQGMLSAGEGAALRAAQLPDSVYREAEQSLVSKSPCSQQHMRGLCTLVYPGMPWDTVKPRHGECPCGRSW